jgi:LPXTG-motif cell wall-anchored protein
MLVLMRKPLTPDEWIGIMIGGTVLLIALLFWLFVRRM